MQQTCRIQKQTLLSHQGSVCYGVRETRDLVFSHPPAPFVTSRLLTRLALLVFSEVFSHSFITYHPVLQPIYHNVDFVDW